MAVFRIWLTNVLWTYLNHMFHLHKHMFHTGDKIPNYSTRQLHVPCQYCGSGDYWSNACAQAKCASLVKPRTIVKDIVKKIQVTPVVTLSTSMFGQTYHMCHQDVHFDTEFPWSRNTPRTQWVMVSLSEVPQWVSQEVTNTSQFP